MARYGMLIDTIKCVNCYACSLSCQTQNGLPDDENFIHFLQREVGKFPNVRREFVPVQCQHCDDAPCIAVCPTKATYIDEDGIVVMDNSKCIGCKYCGVACPYGARVQLHEGMYKKGTYEDGGREYKYTVDKCRFCKELLEVGEDPACVTTCISHARIFGDLDDPNSEISKAIIDKRAEPLRADLGTKPKIYYVR
jgi:Fe-S-cluster-containing dehydrogenase component